MLTVFYELFSANTNSKNVIFANLNKEEVLENKMKVKESLPLSLTVLSLFFPYLQFLLLLNCNLLYSVAVYKFITLGI